MSKNKFYNMKVNAVFIYWISIYKEDVVNISSLRALAVYHEVCLKKKA